MKLSTLIERLQEAQAYAGDIDVAVGEANGVLRSMIDVNIDTEDEADGSEKLVCIIQAYVVKK